MTDEVEMTEEELLNTEEWNRLERLSRVEELAEKMFTRGTSWLRVGDRIHLSWVYPSPKEVFRAAEAFLAECDRRREEK